MRVNVRNVGVRIGVRYVLVTNVTITVGVRGIGMRGVAVTVCVCAIQMNSIRVYVGMRIAMRRIVVSLIIMRVGVRNVGMAHDQTETKYRRFVGLAPAGNLAEPELLTIGRRKNPRQCKCGRNLHWNQPGCHHQNSNKIVTVAPR